GPARRDLEPGAPPPRRPRRRRLRRRGARLLPAPFRGGGRRSAPAGPAPYRSWNRGRTDPRGDCRSPAPRPRHEPEYGDSPGDLRALSSFVPRYGSRVDGRDEGMVDARGVSRKGAGGGKEARG